MQWLYRKFGTGDFRSFFAYLLSHDAHPFIQFCKYGAAGVLATVAFTAVWEISDRWFFPVNENDWNYMISSSIGFVFSNFVAYFTNIRFVFKPGRHSRHHEMLMFFGASLFAFFIGAPLGQWLIIHFDWGGGPMKYVALGVTIIASVMVNYTCRKFFIFKG